MHKRWCRRPETTRADFGTGHGPFSSLVSLSSSLPAGWPCTRATSRASTSRQLDTFTFCRQDTTFGVGHRITDSGRDSLSTGVWRRDQNSSNSGKCQRPSCDFFVRDRLLYHHQLASTASATHPENAIQPNPEVARKTSAERRNHETNAFPNRRCNHLSQERKTIEMRELPRVPCRRCMWLDTHRGHI